MADVNIIGVAAAAVASMVLGMIWYGPLFGKKWVELSGHQMGSGDKAKMPMLYGAAFIGSLVTAYVLAMFIGLIGGTTPMDGAITGFWAWLGFVATTSLGMVLWEMKPVKLYALNNAYNLVNFAVMGAIVAAMG